MVRSNGLVTSSPLRINTFCRSRLHRHQSCCFPTRTGHLQFTSMLLDLANMAALENKSLDADMLGDYRAHCTK